MVTGNVEGWSEGREISLGGCFVAQRVIRKRIPVVWSGVQWIAVEEGSS